MQLKNFSKLLDLLYLGASEEKPWQSFLFEIKQHFNLQHAVIIIRPPSVTDAGIIFTSGGGIPATVTRAYGSDYIERSYATDPLNNLPYEKIVTIAEMFANVDFTESEYYQKCLQPLGIRHVAGVDFEGENNNDFSIRFSRKETQPAFSADDIALLELFIPHIKRAVSYGIKVHHELSEKKVYNESLANRSVGILTLDETGHIVSSNKIADRYLQDNDGLTVRHNHLQFKENEVNEAFKSRFISMIEAQQNRQRIPARALAVPRKSDKLDYELVLKPMPVNRLINTKGSPQVMVFIHDPEINIDISVHLIVSLYNLTVSEAMVAILLTEGKSLDEAAAAQDIAKNTARAHLRSIFAKVGVSKQSMLVSLISKSLASLT